MRSIPRSSMLLLAALGIALAASADESQRVLRVADFNGDAIQSGEASALRNLVTSYVIELKLFRVIDADGQELAIREAETAIMLGTAKDIAPLTADYVLSAKAGKLGGSIVFTMDVIKVATGEKKSISDTFATVNDLILAARRLTRALFEKPDAAQSSQALAPAGSAKPSASAANSQGATQQSTVYASPSLSLISGTWKGDKNVDRVTLLPDGRGYAVLSSGVQMLLKATIEGSTISVVQNQPNSPDFYRPSLDLKSAKQVAQGARPWRWVFALSLDGKSLVGVKESVFVTVTEKGAVSLDNNYVRDSMWTRLYK